MNDKTLRRLFDGDGKDDVVRMMTSLEWLLDINDIYNID